MNTFVKFVFTILGGVLIGLGLGIMAHKNSLLSAGQFEAAMILSLIAGGFFLALGLPGRPPISVRVKTASPRYFLDLQLTKFWGKYRNNGKGVRTAH